MKHRALMGRISNSDGSLDITDQDWSSSGQPVKA